MKSNEWLWICFHKTLKIEIQNGGPNNSDFLHNWFPAEIRSPNFNLRKFQHSGKSTLESCRMHWNLMNYSEFQSKFLLKLKYSKGHQITQTFCVDGFPQELGLPSLVCRYFKTSEKSTPASCRMHWKLMNDCEFVSIKLLKLKYRRGDQIIQTFCIIGSPQKLGPPSLICINFNTLRKVLLNHAESIEIKWMTKNFSLKRF